MGWRVLGELRGGRSGGVEAFGIVDKTEFLNSHNSFERARYT